MDEPVFFGSAVEGLFVRALGPHLDEAARTRIREAGIDLSRPPLPAYPVAVWERAVDLAATAAFPDAPPIEAWHRAGQAFVAGFGQTVMGAAVLSVSAVLGVERTLRRMTRSMRSTNNFSEALIERAAPGRMEIRTRAIPAMNVPSTPYVERSASYVGGVIGTLVTRVGGAGASVERLEFDAGVRSTLFRVTWG